MRARDLVGSVRPRRSTAVLVVVVAIGAGGVGWAATRAANPGVISACANADNVLSLSTSGSCPSGQTLVQWDVQGPQGPPGQQGVPGTSSGPAVLGYVQRRFNGGFTLAATLATPGTFVLDGSVDAALSGTPSGPLITIADHTPECELYTAPPAQPATQLAHWSFTFHHHTNPSRWIPLSLTSPVDVSAAVTVAANQTPLQAYFSCNAGGGTGSWTNPTLTSEAATSASFHPTVGAALPARHTIGPGTLTKVLGAGG